MTTPRLTRPGPAFSISRQRMASSVAAVLAFSIGLSVEPDFRLWTTGAGPLPTAEARIGRPLTPLSYAGVARRTTRRAVRRSTVLYPALPAGCRPAVVDGVQYQLCGGSYYQPYQGQYAIVYFD